MPANTTTEVNDNDKQEGTSVIPYVITKHNLIIL
jgi:hypothetical protein